MTRASRDTTPTTPVEKRGGYPSPNAVVPLPKVPSGPAPGAPPRS